MSGFELNNYRKGSGFTVNHLQAGAAVPAYNVVYLDAAGQWQLADADAVATMPTVGVTMEALVAGNLGRVLLIGLCGLNAWTWTPGAILYASTTAGGMTETAPTGTGDQRQALAQAISATHIYFNPSLSSLDSLGMFNYETTTEPITEPVTVSKGNGHTVIQYYTDGQNRSFMWTTSNDVWVGVEML